MRHGLDDATGDILVVVEADCSFGVTDLSKLLEYLKDADMVIGTRTTRELMSEEARNMRGTVRWGNVLVAKGVELLWWGRQLRFTDVGCTYRWSPYCRHACASSRCRYRTRRMGGESEHSALG